MFCNRKALYAAILLCVTTLSSPSLGSDEISESLLYEQIKESVNKKTMMQTKRWNTPDYGSDEGQEKEDDKSDAKDENTTEDADEANLTEQQKIWNKYKKLAEDGKKEAEKKSSKDKKEEQDEKTAENTVEKEEAAEEETAKSEEETEEKEPTGIAAVLKRYKDAQETKGVLNSRSFGSVE